MRQHAVPLVFALVLHTASASAEWRAASQDGFSKIYFDPVSRQTLADGSVVVRALTDYDPQSSEAASFKLSEKGLSEIEKAVFDCAQSAYRSDGGSWFAGQMATGAVRSDYPAKTAWSKVPSYYLSLFSKVCARE